MATELPLHVVDLRLERLQTRPQGLDQRVRFGQRGGQGRADHRPSDRGRLSRRAQEERRFRPQLAERVLFFKETRQSHRRDLDVRAPLQSSHGAGNRSSSFRRHYMLRATPRRDRVPVADMHPPAGGPLEKRQYRGPSEKGSRFVERLLTTLMTCRQQERNVLDFLTSVRTAALNGTPAPSLVPRTRSP